MRKFLGLILVLLGVCSQVLSFRMSVRRFAPPAVALTMAATETSTTQIFAQIQAQVHGALNEKVKQGKAPVKFVEIVKGFLDEYATTAIEAGLSPDTFKYQVQSLLKFVQDAMENPFKFEPGMHHSIRQPFDYYKWGNDFMRPLIIMDKSRLVGLENAKRMIELINKGDNVIILANHQTECDPQAISILLEREGLGEFAEKMIYIAGHKVTTDPIAIPFSMGRNLICIHSKKHIKNPPEEFPKKQAENMESMKSMGALINEGGKVIWLAPSGGRDRPDATGNFGMMIYNCFFLLMSIVANEYSYTICMLLLLLVVAPFDYKSLDMFKLMAMQSGKPLHFFPMAMYTHKLVPPPNEAATAALGETRSAKRGPVSVHFLDETDGLGGLKDKEFSAALQKSVEDSYSALCAWHDAN